MDDVLAVHQRPLELDLIKEINVNNNLLSNIRVHCPENIYGKFMPRKMILMM
jgi:branched-chain amino acid aminotransferase